MSKASNSGKAPRWRLLTWLVVLPLLIVFFVQLYFLLMVCWYAQFNPRQTNMMSDQLQALQAKNPRAVLRHEWVPYERISIHLKQAVIASEDANFADHDGVDWEALQAAYARNNRRHKVVGGGSTITQQLAKNLFLSGSRSYLRKGQEMIIAFMLETVMSKERILELYLNVVEYGRGIFGALEAAAKYYYRIHAANLGEAQAAKLAVMLPNPRYYDRHRDTRYLNRRTALIVSRMEHPMFPDHPGRQRGAIRLGWVAVGAALLAALGMAALASVRSERNLFADAAATLGVKLGNSSAAQAVREGMPGAAVRRCVIQGKTVISNIDCKDSNPTSRALDIRPTRGVGAPRPPAPPAEQRGADAMTDKMIEKQLQ